MMEKRKILKFFVGVVAIAATLQSYAQGFSLGALDMIVSGERPLESVQIGALEAVSAANKTEQESFGALAYVTSAKKGELRSEPLSFISRSAGSQGYYSSGAWEAPDFMTAQRRAGASVRTWIGQMYMAPEWGRITSAFGFRPKFGRMHKGIDLAMAVGDTVRVPLPGVVNRVSYESGGYGNYVVVSHSNGLETRYAHLSAVLVSPGESLSPNQPIALSGNTGNSTGPHLHFETRVNGAAIDPQTVFDFAGGLMMAKSKAYGNTGYSAATAAGVLNSVSEMGVRGKSLSEKRRYVVKAGDTLDKIAARAGTTVLELCKLNFISQSDQLKPGTMIRLSR